MKQQVECRDCGNKIWSTIVKVYVFKQRICDKCKGPLHYIPKTGYIECPDCKIAWNLKEKDVLNLGVKIIGTSRDKSKADEMEGQGYEVDKSLIPINTQCVKCKNLEGRKRDELRKLTKDETKISALSGDVVSDLLKREVQKTIIQTNREKIALTRKTGKEESVTPMTPMLMTPFNTEPLNKPNNIVIKESEKK
jgi:uncharacterized Zn finger protein (UPF0148 family)